jgi:2-polyprenyl-6-methoxyphenol hydroxylase-like FAD-dependent oxidoreductase
MLGLLLARAGVDVVVLEKHADFFRDFRGDTIHYSTLQILDDIGLADAALRIPHSEASEVDVRTPSGQRLTIPLTRISERFPAIAFMPQWDFLDFVTREAKRYPTFRLLMNAEATGLVESFGRIRGVRVQGEDGESVVEASLVVGTDGRSSVTREAAGLQSIATSPPMDVLWFRISRRPDEPEAVAGRLGRSSAAILIDRDTYWQIAFIIPKGGAEQVKARGLDDLRNRLLEVAPDLGDRVNELQSWDDVKLLEVRSDRLRTWYRAGYLAIGDAAHAMTPVGGVGINLAIQDAVVAANVFWRPLRFGSLRTRSLAEVQRHRELPTRLVQGFQSLAQRTVISSTLQGSLSVDVPPLLPKLLALPLLRDVPGQLISFRFGRPKVKSPAAFR